MTKGFWALKMIRKSVCLDQISLSDGKDIKDCYLYKLSESEVINQIYSFLGSKLV